MLESVFVWWLMVFLLGLVNLPLTGLIFASFRDRGYAFAKIIAIALVSYLVWLTAILKILPFTFFSVVFFTFLSLILNLFLLKRKKESWENLKKSWRLFILEEIIFFSGLFFWSWIRSFQPDIHGLEKFMDFGFVNAILRSRWFPPNDMWLAGGKINYYYFGHLETAILTRLSGLKPSVAYNLMLGNLCGLMLSAGFAISFNLIHWLSPQKRRLASFLGGLMAALLLTFGGNLQLIYHWSQNRKSQNTGVWPQQELDAIKTYWYPDATRFIIEKFGANDNTIHEFPIYSLVVADLHGHLLDIPQVFLIIALLITIWQRNSQKEAHNQWLEKTKKLLSWFKKVLFSQPKKIFPAGGLAVVKIAITDTLPRLPHLTLLAFILGITFMTNAWDYPIYLLLSGATLLTWQFFLSGKGFTGLITTALSCLWLVILSLFFSLPFHLNFENIAQGVALVDFRTPAWMFPFLWGFPLFTSISLVAFLRFSKNKVRETDWLVLAFLIIAWSLIFIPEIIRVKDIYAHNHQRANTMFKLTYQAFMIFRLLGTYILIRLLTGLKSPLAKRLFLFLFMIGAGILLTYPRLAIGSYYNKLKEARGLDGLAYLENFYPDDYQAILWLNQKVSGSPIIVEAVGDSYTDYARVSANTGLPTILGWRVHEWLWRGTYDISSQRDQEVIKIYTSPDRQEVKDLLGKYQVKYVFVGTLEKQAYPQLDEANLASLGKIVFISGETRIYQIN
ncbi:MAG: hypothetical protein JW991_02975 [Candidatus Pacebacteria bacterium]|nr:hypothetical protein [Candidatus Paceibacterota bacterium]